VRLRPEELRAAERAGIRMPVEEKEEPPAPPTPLARRLVRYVVGFGIGVGLGMAPFLGKVPGMEALLQLFPANMHEMLLPLSVFLMGLVAVAVQFYSSESISRQALRRRFSIGLSCLLAGLALFLILYSTFVERFPYRQPNGEVQSTPVILGFSRTAGCRCEPRIVDAKCLEQLTLQPGAIESCWGSRPVRLVRLSFSFSYLLLTGGFAALIGLLLLQEQSRQRGAAKRKR
jgi:hypothetical protein